jgi:hypothetical protein
MIYKKSLAEILYCKLIYKMPFITHPFKAHLSVGGSIQTIQVGGKRYRFEMHPVCGPIALSKRDKELKEQPLAFLEAASFWAQQGRRVDEDGLCVWEWPAQEEYDTVPIGRRSAKVVGVRIIPARKGE